MLNLISLFGGGVFASAAEAVASCARVAEENRPDPKWHATYARTFELYDEARRGLTGVNHRLHNGI